MPHPDLAPTHTPNSFQCVLFLSGCIASVASDLILVELDGGQQSLFYNPFPFGLNFSQSLGGVSTSLSHVARNAHSQVR